MNSYGKLKVHLFSEIKILSSRLAWKTAILTWLLIVLTIMLFIVFTTPYFKQTAVERMQNEAADIASSIVHANASALITEEYSYVVEHCFNLVRESNSILYVIIVKSNGFSLIHYKDKWEIDSLDNNTIRGFKHPEGIIMNSTLLGKEVFHKSHNFVYSGIDWGWIHVGLSLDNYNKSNEETTLRITWLTVLLSVVGFIFSIFFARKLTKPITILGDAARKIAAGNLDVKADIQTGDELESLANSFNTMAEAVKKSHVELEGHVVSRTLDLAKANESLMSEVQIRKKAEQTLHNYNQRINTFQNIFKGLIEAKTTQEIMVTTVNQLSNTLIDFDCCIVVLFDYENDKATIYSVDKVNSELKFEEQTTSIMNFRMTYNPTGNELNLYNDLTTVTNKSVMESQVFAKGFNSYLNSSLKFHGNVIGEINLLSRRKDSFSEKDFEIIIELRHPLTVAISQLALQNNLKKQTEQLQVSLKEKEILLKEIHHRVKNNLQIVSSLLYLQSGSVKDTTMLNILADSQNRVRTMALVHEKLYQSKELSKINFAEFIKNLSSYIFSSYKEYNDDFSVEYDMDDLQLSIDSAVPLGLIINELLSNAVKYAFPKAKATDAAKVIKIGLKKSDINKILVFISDNGVGLPEDFEIGRNNSLGLQLVSNLVRQIDGNLTLHARNETEFKIEFIENK